MPARGQYRSYEVPRLVGVYPDPFISLVDSCDVTRAPQHAPLTYDAKSGLSLAGVQANEDNIGGFYQCRTIRASLEVDLFIGTHVYHCIFIAAGVFYDK